MRSPYKRYRYSADGGIIPAGPTGITRPIPLRVCMAPLMKQIRPKNLNSQTIVQGGEKLQLLIVLFSGKILHGLPWPAS